MVELKCEGALLPLFSSGEAKGKTAFWQKRRIGGDIGDWLLHNGAFMANSKLLNILKNWLLLII
jgi:hypothetical protein